MRLGVCYYPEQWDPAMWRDDARRMADLGLSIVRIGEFAWSLIEPEPNKFNWQWLDDAIEVLAEQGLEVMLGTPTATPPKWLIDQHSDILAWDHEGQERRFGSRRHYCFSSIPYQGESQRITEAMAARYGSHTAVTMWQTDNEFGCHDTVRSYSPMARDAFRLWLEKKYGNVSELNEAWGTTFWSQTYRGFGEVELPNLTVTEANPSHWLDFFRFSSDQVVNFHRQQADIIKQHAPLSPITHNAMGHFFDFDHFDFGQHVDILTWDSYPLGFLRQSRAHQDHKAAYMRQGDPDFAAFHHDLYRGCAPRFAVIEQQPGPVNWAPDNPAPRPGMVKLWMLETLAHGGAFASIFRWRQAPFAQEQNHAGLLRPDNQPAAGYHEIEEVRDSITSLTDGIAKADIALIFDYETLWMSEIQPQGTGWNYQDIAEQWFRAARRLGFSIDIVKPGTALTDYKLVLVPSLFHVAENAMRAFEATDAHLLFGPRCGSKDKHGNIPKGLAPDHLRGLMPLTVARSETVPGWVKEPVALASGHLESGHGHWVAWRDEVETDLEPVLTDTSNRPVLFHHGRVQMFTALPDDDVLNVVLRNLCVDASLKPVDLPEGLRIRRGCGQVFAFNYSNQPQSVPTSLLPNGNEGFTLGKRTIQAGGLAAWPDNENQPKPTSRGLS